MWGLLYYCVTLAITNPLWVEALPANIAIDKIETNNVDIKIPECPENEFFNHEGKGCELTCKFPIPQDLCNEEKVAACECVQGYVRNETGICVTLVQCYNNFNIPYNVEYNTPEPTTDKVIFEEFTPTSDTTQSTNTIDDTYTVTTYDTDEFEDSHELPSLFHPLSDAVVGIVVNSGVTRQMQENILMVLHEIRAQEYIPEKSVDSDQQYLKDLLRSTVREELDSYLNSDYYEGNDNISF